MAKHNDKADLNGAADIAQILQGIGNINPLDYDFAGPLPVEGGRRVGTLSPYLRQVYGARAQQMASIVALERQLRAAKKVAKVLEQIFDLGVQDEFPTDMRVEQTPTGMRAHANESTYFGPGGAVYKATTDAMKAAVEQYERENPSRDDEGEMPDILGAILSARGGKTLPGLLDMIQGSR